MPIVGGLDIHRKQLTFDRPGGEPRRPAVTRTKRIDDPSPHRRRTRPNARRRPDQRSGGTPI